MNIPINRYDSNGFYVGTSQYKLIPAPPILADEILDLACGGANS